MKLILCNENWRWQNWMDVFYRKLRICLEHLQNTKDLRIVDYNRLPLSCIRSVEC